MRPSSSSLPGEGQEDTRARTAFPDDPQQCDIINLFSNPRTRLLVTGYDTLQVPAAQANNEDMTVGHLGLTDQEENLIVTFLQTLNLSGQ
jgi:hypothetical protein